MQSKLTWIALLPFVGSDQTRHAQYPTLNLGEREAELGIGGPFDYSPLSLRRVLFPSTSNGSSEGPTRETGLRHDVVLFRCSK
jgi:hypothetical protein